MKKILKISLIVLAVLLLLAVGWYFIIRDPNVPVGDSLRNMLPFGSGENVPFPTDVNLQPDITPEDERDELAEPENILFRISERPVAGFVVLPPSTSSGQATSTTVRYTDRATGHITDARLADLEKRRITNITLPKIYEAHYRSDGLKVLYRSLHDGDTVENISLTLTPPTSTSTDELYAQRATILDGNMLEVTAGVGDVLYYVLDQAVTSSTFDGASRQTWYAASFNNWRLSPYGPSLIAWTKASSNTPGYMYVLGANGSLSKVVGPLNGLTVSADLAGRGLAYSYNDEKLRLFARSTLGGSESEIFPATLAEKCAWSSGSKIYCGIPTAGIGAGEPDNWYKGISHYSDDIWSFDVDTEIAEVLAQPKTLVGVDLDVYQPQVSPNEDYLLFINKNDLSLWALRLEE